jgi:hypothetical protein
VRWNRAWAPIFVPSDVVPRVLRTPVKAAFVPPAPMSTEVKWPVAVGSAESSGTKVKSPLTLVKLTALGGWLARTVSWNTPLKLRCTVPAPTPGGGRRWDPVRGPAQMQGCLPTRRPGGNPCPPA